MKLNPIFSSNMVFAVNKPIMIYGTGNGSAEISFAGQKKSVVSNEEKWCVEFPKMEYGGPYELEIAFEDEKVCLSDIYVGEVYLFAGQSNMEFKMKESSTPESFYNAYDKLRLFSTDKVEGGDRYTSKDGWIKSEQENIKDWTAIGYLAGSEIVRNKNVAVGIIACYQGASSIESWLPKGTYKRLGINLADNEKHPGLYYKEPLSWHHEEILYSFALSQVTPFPVSAVVWYQGESNTAPKESKFYIRTLEEFIRICRKDFNDPKLPFVIVQIADFTERNDDGWRTVQKAQIDVQELLPEVKTVISADVCEDNEIHPKTKYRLANRIVKTLETFI